MKAAAIHTGQYIAMPICKAIAAIKIKEDQTATTSACRLSFSSSLAFTILDNLHKIIFRQR